MTHFHHKSIVDIFPVILFSIICLAVTLPGSEKYECTLTKASLQKAEQELHEIPAEREGAVESLRQWVNANSSWLKSPTDTRFLLYILRPSKFVQLAARKRLVKFWETRTKNKLFFENIDTHDPAIVEGMCMGNVIALPKRDEEGRTHFIYRPGSIDMAKISLVNLRKATVALVDSAFADENTQVNGTVIIHDFSGMTLKHQKFYGLDNFRKGATIWIHGIAARYKDQHYYNTNPVFQAIFAVIAPMIPDKLKKRLRFHGSNLAGVYKFVDKSLLPQDYLPDDYCGETIGTVQQLLEKQVKMLQEPATRDYILRMSTSGYGVDLAKKPSDQELFTESFRQLNVD